MVIWVALAAAATPPTTTPPSPNRRFSDRYTPYAYQEDIPVRNEAKMEQALEVLDRKYCQCPYGAAGKRVGYLCPGTCLDWIYDKLKTPYAFAFEIYVTPSRRGEPREVYEEEQREEASGVGGAHAFLQVGSKATVRQMQLLKGGHHMDPDDCFPFFNPTGETEYNEVVSKWSRAFMELIDMMHDDQVAQHAKEGKAAAIMAAAKGAAAGSGSGGAAVVGVGAAAGSTLRGMMKKKY